MALIIKMPALSPTMTEGVLAKWLVSEGDKIKSGDVIAEIETDKATMELESADDGVIEAIEYKNHPFCFGVQWHPELLDINLIQELIGSKG